MPVGNPGATPWFRVCSKCGATVPDGDPHSCPPPPEPKDDKKGAGKK